MPFGRAIGRVRVWALLVSGVTAASMAPAANSAPSLTGKWRVNATIPQGQAYAGSYTLSLDLVESNGQLTGTGTWDAGVVSSFTGSVGNGQVTLNRLDRDGYRMRLVGREVDANHFQGTFDQATNGATGSFVMTRLTQNPTTAPPAAPPRPPASAPTAAPSPSPASGGVRYRVENFVYGNPDVYQSPRNYHDFIVDFANCSMRELNAETTQGRETIRVTVCRDRTRLTFTTQIQGQSQPVEYDWVFLNGGKTISGAYRQGGTFGPSVGGIYQP
jgi:hypothetical protein